MKTEKLHNEKRMKEEINELKEKLYTCQIQSRSSESELRHVLTLKEDQIRANEKTTKELQSYMNHKDKMVKDMQQEISTLNSRPLTNLSHMMEPINYVEDDSLTLKECLKQQNSQISDYEKKIRWLEHENKRLEYRTARLETLEEEKMSLKSRLDLLEDMRNKLLKTEAELIQLNKEKASWMSYFQDKEYDSPVALSRALVTQQQEYALLLEKHGSLTTQLHKAETQIEEAYTKVRLCKMMTLFVLLCFEELQMGTHA
jgi:mitotic spindle assembly checkpoint protein MAD1